MGTIIKPGITADGFRTAVRDYTEPTVVEELAANSYDADASTVLVLLDTQSNHLYIIDDGFGFSEEAIKTIATLGSGDKQEIAFSKGKRHFLGSYGYGLKSTLNIASKIEVTSFSEDGEFKVTIDWHKLDEALKPSFEGYPFHPKSKDKDQKTGTIIKLFLKNPTSKDQLEQFGEVLANLPNDNGNFLCYYSLYDSVCADLGTIQKRVGELRQLAQDLEKKHKLFIAGTSLLTDINQCQKEEIQDKADKTVKGTFYFAGLDGDKVRPLKPGLKGIYVRIHGRLLKQNFDDSEYTYNISKWLTFGNGLRVELDIDWLQDQITLSREGIRFSNTKLQSEFKTVLNRLISRFIQPHLQKIQNRKSKELDKKHKQRLELAKRRSEQNSDLVLPVSSTGFNFKPETDGELAMLLAQKEFLKKVNKDFVLLDYNDKAPFDAIILDTSRREHIYVEFEPTLMEFLEHKETEHVQMIITWSLGKWRVGAKKKGKKGNYELTNTTPQQNGCFKLLEYATATSKKPRKDYSVVVLEDLI